MLVGALMLLYQPAIADDLDDLKATHQKYIMAENTGDVETIFAIFQDQAVLIRGTDGIPKTIVKERAKKGYGKWRETHSVRHIEHKPDFRVIGNTGLVWGLVERTVVDKKSGIAQIFSSRSSCVYVKSDGKWTLVLIHASSNPQTQTLY
jgi:ketosteroid isomerase-like protein